MKTGIWMRPDAQCRADMFNKEPFVVSHETVQIGDKLFELEDTTHFVLDGQEYILLGDQWYELNGSVVGNHLILPDETPVRYDPSPPRSKGWGSTIATILIIFFIVVAGLKVLKALDHADNAITTIEANPTLSSVVAAGTETPKATSTIPTATATATAAPKATSTPATWATRASNIVDAMDYTNPTTRDYALSLIDKTHSGNYNIGQICDIWEKLYNRWTYVNDPNGDEYYSPASRTINLGLKGDCDDFAILVASTMLAIDGSPRIILAQNKNEAGHAYAELYIADSKDGLQKTADYICKRYHCKNIAYRTSYDNGKTRYWLNLDWSAKHPGGSYYQNDGTTIAVYPNKYWVRLK